MEHRSSSAGFTLIELLVVITIIGILSTMILMQLNYVRARARDIKRIYDVHQLRTAVEMYYDDHGTYPKDLGSDAMSAYFPNNHIPTDPVLGRYYMYSYYPADNPTKYQIWAELERQNIISLNLDHDINSNTWYGNGIDAADPASEKCEARFSIGARDCIYDVGQPF